MTKTRRAGFSKKRRRGGRKTMKRRGRKQRTRVKRRGRKRSIRRRRRRGGAGTTHHVNNANTVNGSWKHATAKAHGQPDGIRHADDIVVKQPWGKQSYRPYYFDVTGSQDAVNKFKGEETIAGSAKNTGENVDIFNWIGYYPTKGDFSEMTSYMTKNGYGPVIKDWLGGPPGDNK